MFVECPEDNNPRGSPSYTCLSRSQQSLLSLFDLQPPASLGEPFPTGFRTGPVKLGVVIVLKNAGKIFPEEGAQQASEEGSTARKEVPYAPQV